MLAADVSTGRGAGERLRSRGKIAALLALAALVVAHWLATAVFTREPITPFGGDLVNYYVPFYDVTFERIAQGRFPLWNPWQLTGLPWYATLQVAVFYPPHWLYALLPVHVALAMNHLLHLLLVAFASARFARQEGLSPAAAGMASLVFTLQGANQFWLTLPPLLEAGAWLAPGCLAVSRLARGGGARAAALLALAVGLSWLAGMPQITVHLVYAWTSLFAVLLLRQGLPLRQLAARGAGFAGALAAGAALAAVQLLPTFALTLEATRETQALAREEVGYLAESAGWFARRTLVGGRFSFGPVAAALLAAAAFARGRRALAGWALGLGLSAWLLALGGESWAFPIYQRLPGVGWFRDPRKLFLLVQFAVALLAAQGLDAALGREAGRAAEGPVRPQGGGALRARLPLALALAVAALVAADRAWPALLSALLVAAVLALRPPGRPARLPGSIGAAALLLAGGLDGFSAASQRGRVPYDRDSTVPYGRHAPFFERVASLAGESRVTWLPPRLFYEIKLQPRYRLRGLDDYEPLTLRRQARYFDFLLYAGDPSRAGGELFFGAILRSFDLPPPEARRVLAEVARRRRLLDLAAARYYLAIARPPGGESASAFARAAGLVELPSPDPIFRLFQSPEALPRAFVTYRTLPAPEPEELLARIARRRFDPLVASFVEGGSPLPENPGAPARGHPAAIVRDEEVRVEVEAELGAPGLLVLADSYASGWRASVDGEPAEVLAANHLFRGVVVPPGRHRVRFEYRPWSLPAGLAGSLAGGLLVLALALRVPPGRAPRSLPTWFPDRPFPE
jgi:hypothetical protein